MATMNSNPLDILHCQNPLFPGSRSALSCGDVWTASAISSQTQEPSPYEVEDEAVSHNYFKSAVPALDQKNDFRSQDDALRALDNNHGSNSDDEVFTRHQSPRQNRQYSHDFTPDASDGRTGSIQSRLGSKESLIVPPGFERWYDVEEGRYVFEEVLEEKEVVASSEGREGELGDQNEEAERVGMVATTEESGNSQELNEDTSPRRVKQQSPPPRGDPSPEPAQKERDGSAHTYDDYNNMESVQGDKGQHYTPKDPNISPSDPEGRISIGYSEQQQSSSNKRYDLNARLADSMPGWMALKVATRCQDSATAEQDLGDAGSLIAISQIVADVMCGMAYPISREIERRLQDLPNSLKRQWFSDDEEGLGAKALGHGNHNVFGSYLSTSLSQSPPKVKKRGRPASQPQSPPKAQKRSRPAPQAQPLKVKKRGRPPKARALAG